MIKAIIFDCFGVVLGDGLSALTHEFTLQNPEALQEIMSWLDRSNKGLLSAEESSRQISAIFGITYEQYRERIDRAETRNEELLAYILKLRRQDYKTAMLSNIPKGSLARRFTPEELDRYFDTTVASGEIGYAKPEARAYEITAERLGVRLDECVFTDDREHYVEGAQAVGMQAIIYEDFPQFKRELDALLAS